jgi:hypothetical protein
MTVLEEFKELREMIAEVAREIDILLVMVEQGFRNLNESIPTQSDICQGATHQSNQSGLE